MNFFIYTYKLIYDLCPWYLRNDFFMLWVSALLHPFQQLNLSFFHLANSVRYKTAFNGSVMLLEHILNDTFDPTGRGIYISNGNLSPALYFSFESESIEEFVYNDAETALSGEIYSFSEVEIEGNYVDFVVNVPSGLSLLPSNFALNAYICDYKLIGKSYQVVLF